MYALDLPSTEDAGKEGWQDDVAFIHHTVEQLADQGRNIVLVAHSRGGLPASDAAEGLSITDRAKHDKLGGIVRIVYMAAFAGPEGVSIDIVTQGNHDAMVVEGTRC